MATPIKMPDFGTTIDHVTLVKWLVKEGDTVKRGDLLCEVETDKAVSELESIAEGTVLKLLAEVGAEIEQSTTIAYVGQPGEVPDTGTKEPGPGSPVPATGGPSAPPCGGDRGDAAVPPMIRNLARKEGVDLSRVTGTGPGGRITREDVLKAKAAAAEIAVPAGKPLSANQLVVARRVVRSQREIPAIALEMRIDMTNVLRLREGMARKTGTKVSFDAFFVKAAATAMKEFPHFRSRVAEERVLESEDVGVGVAIGVAHDLYIPVLHGADGKHLPELDAEIRALAQQAGNGKFAAEQLTGATLTISNLGMFPVRAFHAIIPPDQTAVLAVGATEETPVVRQGTTVSVPLATVVLAVDHRLINGREAAEFLTRLKTVLEG